MNNRRKIHNIVASVPFPTDKIAGEFMVSIRGYLRRSDSDSELFRRAEAAARKAYEDVLMEQTNDEIAEELMQKYVKESDTVMDEFLGFENNASLSVSEAFKIYMELMHKSCGDRFFRCIGENADSLPNELPKELEKY